MIRPVPLATLAPCSSQTPPADPEANTAPLALAKDRRMILARAGKCISGSRPEERGAADDDYMKPAGQDTARDHKWFDSEEDRHVVQIDAFRIDLMPVTQAEYAEFVLAKQAPAPGIDEAAWKA